MRHRPQTKAGARHRHPLWTPSLARSGDYKTRGSPLGRDDDPVRERAGGKHRLVARNQARQDERRAKLEDHAAAKRNRGPARRSAEGPAQDDRQLPEGRVALRSPGCGNLPCAWSITRASSRGVFHHSDRVFCPHHSSSREIFLIVPDNILISPLFL